jgi:uncharacterized protein
MIEPEESMAILVPVTALYGAVNAIFNVVLATNVSRNRGRSKVFAGVGADEGLTRANRAHGNNSEYVALAVVMLMIAELSGGGSTVLHVFGGTLTAARLLHAHGMFANFVPTRATGATLTWLTIVGLAVYALMLRYGGQ